MPLDVAVRAEEPDGMEVAGMEEDVWPGGGAVSGVETGAMVGMEGTADEVPAWSCGEWSGGICNLQKISIFHLRIHTGGPEVPLVAFSMSEEAARDFSLEAASSSWSSFIMRRKFHAIPGM